MSEQMDRNHNKTQGGDAVETILTFDVGTTAIKTCLFDKALNCLAIRTDEYTLSTELGTVELDCEVYWNVKRMYNSTTKQTTRVPDEDGYYVFKMTQDGKVKEYKTKDKAIATKVDSYSTAFGLALSGNVIEEVKMKAGQDGVINGILI